MPLHHCIGCLEHTWQALYEEAKVRVRQKHRNGTVVLSWPYVEKCCFNAHHTECVCTTTVVQWDDYLTLSSLEEWHETTQICFLALHVSCNYLASDHLHIYILPRSFVNPAVEARSHPFCFYSSRSTCAFVGCLPLSLWNFIKQGFKTRKGHLVSQGKTSQRSVSRCRAMTQQR